MQFSMKPSAGESGFQQWHSAMKMVARLPGGIPHEFRKTVRPFNLRFAYGCFVW